MAHKEQMDFVKEVKERFPDAFLNKRVLEIGSLNINGTIRKFFNNCEYVGLDLGPGKDVDVVCGGHEYGAPDNSFDVCASCECFEHNPYWKESFENMIRLCKPNGLIFMTCATTGRHEHGTDEWSPDASPYTTHYYRNLDTKDFLKEFDMNQYFSSYEFIIQDKHLHGLFFYGIKK
jgi:SAM-dependent methyltransferase